jgi:hypothetical protein
MPTAFIVRPFGKQKTRIAEKTIEIDFDAVERDLIDPVLTRLGITGRTTGEIVEAGNIRDDMFQLLLTRDLVVADLTIHNANVFYELGIRHALRDMKTFLIRGKGDPMPFDNLTDRYFEYDLSDPAASIDKLAEAIKRTIDSESSDSPVFRSIPNLTAQDVGLFVTVPSGFGKECELALQTGRVGDLLLLASEAKGFDWEIAGLRAVGRALFNIKVARPAARDTWEAIRERLPEDREANELLGTIYQRLSETAKTNEEKTDHLTRSNQAIRTVLEIKQLPMRMRAEQYALLGRNEKSLWLGEWNDLAEGKREAALNSTFLVRSLEEYGEGFDVDLNHYYSGLNAAAMLTVLTSLAEELPDVWSSMHRSDKEAGEKLEQYRQQLAELSTTVKLSLEAERKRLEADDKEDIWFEISLADFDCLTLKKRPTAVAHSYRNAMAKAKDLNREAAARQLLIYQDLGLMTDNVKAALAVLNPPGAPAPTASPRTLLFTGHRIDDANRETPRFPASKEAEARRAIEEAVDAEVAAAAKEGRKVVGIAGGASGGDILFHEICRQRGIESTLYLAMPREGYIKASVSGAGPGWIDRFNQLAAVLPARTLSQSDELPVWLRLKKDYTIWDRSNLWMLQNALVNGGENATVIALWDGNKGDGPGGTENMVKRAEGRGAKVFRLDTKALFGL